MLPRVIYESLPYAYLIIGLLGGVLVDSNIIFIASILLMSAGILVLLMRYNFRRDALDRRMKMVESAQADFDSLLSDNGEFVKRSQKDRRRHETEDLPVTDVHGGLIKFDRRSGERRGITA